MQQWCGREGRCLILFTLNLTTARTDMKTILFVSLLTTLLLATASPGDAQPAQAPRIGYLFIPPLSTVTHRSEAFRRGLSELGYVEGKTIAVEWRSSEGDQQRLRALVAELLRLKVDVIVSGGSAVTRVVKEATSTIPIIMAQDSDPVGNRFVASLARPGGISPDYPSLRRRSEANNWSF